MELEVLSGSANEEYIARIHSYYNLFSDSERKIGDFLLTNGHEKNQKYNINDIAALTGTSTATVVRFCRTLGFSGFSEFKVYMSKGILSPSSGSQPISEGGIGAIKQRTGDLSRNSIDSALDVLDSKSLEKAITLISEADRIFVCGEGGIGGLVQIAVGAFLNAGMESFFISDASLQSKYINMLTPRDVVIGVTNSGCEKTVVDSQKIAVECGIPTISVTSIHQSLATKYADVVLLTSQRDNQNPLDLISVTISHLTVFNALQMGYISQKAEQNRERILEINRQRFLKHYAQDVEEVKMDAVRF